VALFGTDPLDELHIPDGTHVQEHDLVTEGNVVVASQSDIEFGVRGHTVIAGERVQFGRQIEAEGDCRLDTWCDVEENVLVGEDAYLGERVHIGGELRVAGNLDIGDDVQIDEGFEANGWIVIRNPMPTVVFLFVYLTQLLRIGEEDAAEQLLDAMTEADERDHEPVLIPRGSRVADDTWQVSTPGQIGDDCRLHGNVRAESLVVGRDNEIFGSLRARQGITVGSGTEVTGNVTTREGTVRVGPGTTVRGDLSGEFVEVHREATVEGAIRASEEMSMVSEPVLDDAVAADVTGETDDTDTTERTNTSETDGEPAGDGTAGASDDDPGDGEARQTVQAGDSAGEPNVTDDAGGPSGEDESDAAQTIQAGDADEPDEPDGTSGSTDGPDETSPEASEVMDAITSPEGEQSE
jgi:predicted acyltransferase (DUF342 family)